MGALDYVTSDAKLYLLQYNILWMCTANIHILLALYEYQL
jgi:hypothetical protein